MAEPELAKLHSREYIYDLEKHWDKLLSGDEIDESKVRPVVMESWRRCKNHGIDPLKASAPVDIVDEGDGPTLSEKRLYGVIRDSLKSVSHHLEDAKSILIGTDRNGKLVFVEGNDALSDDLAANAVTVGATWDELEIGTNAVGTALKVQRQIMIHGHEHFCEAGKSWSCAADVIRDPIDHSILGVVDLTGPAETIALHANYVISALVERIESELSKLDLMDQLALIDSYHERPANNTGLVMVDWRGKVIRRNSWTGLDHARLQQGGFVPGLQGLTPDRWSLDLAHEALRGGEIEWIQSGNEVIGAAIHVGRNRPARRKVAIPKPLQTFVEVCPSQSSLVEQAAILVDSDVPILITGETGVGKEVLSSAIHHSGKRATKPFIAVNCSAIPRDLIGMELFGYVEGAFTGARRGGMTGRIEDAAGGTLFLDEIGDMPLEMQPYLLRVLETGQVTRIGESKGREINLRIITATHQPLEELAQEGKFRSDLFYRLNVARLHIPPLRDRPSDIVPLSYRILGQISKERDITDIDRKTLAFLMSYDFPGNVRELKSIMQRYALGLPVTPLDEEDQAEGQSPRTLAEIEWRAIQQALERHEGSVEKAAVELAVPRSTLYRRLARSRKRSEA